MPSYLTNEDVQNFGPELVDFSQRAAVQAVAPHLQALEQQNAELRNHLARQTKHNIDQALDNAVPNWREINRHPQWLEWLQESDPYSRVKRQRLLDEAVERGDATRVIAFFRGFLGEEAWRQGAANQRQSGGRTLYSSPRIYSRDQITQMARRRQKGLISDADWARWEYELVAAGREGRIVGALDPETGLARSIGG